MAAAAAEVHVLREQLRDVYNVYRTALLNRKYYGYRLATVRYRNRLLEICLAVAASSTVANWLIWQDSAGAVVWAVFGGITTVLAVAKPIVNLPAEIERCTKLFTSHGDVVFDIQRIVSNVRTHQSFSEADRRAFAEALARQKELTGDDDASPNRKLIARCQAEVNQQIPASSLWMPAAE